MYNAVSTVGGIYYERQMVACSTAFAFTQLPLSDHRTYLTY